MRIGSAATEQVVEPVAAPQVAEAPVVQPEAQRRALNWRKSFLPAVVEAAAEHVRTVKPANPAVCRVVHVVPSSPARRRRAPSLP
ncbi:MAG: hypothetical protein ACLR17_11520 [Enterobacteriaceae bacterium]